MSGGSRGVLIMHMSATPPFDPALARSAADGHDAMVEWISTAQAWAVDVCLDAGLELLARSGAVFLGGDVGPFQPYLPSGAYL